MQIKIDDKIHEIAIPAGWRVVLPLEKVKEGDRFLNLGKLEEGEIVFEDTDKKDLRGRPKFALLIRKK